MSNVSELQPASKQDVEASVTDRRRPGRQENVSPELIPLLRGAVPGEIAFDETDQLRGARGIVAGIALATPLWLALAVFGRWLFF